MKQEIIAALLKAKRPDLANAYAEVVRAAGAALNIANVPVQKARQYSERVFEKAGKDLAAEIPDFDKNYALIQRSLKKTKDIPRIQMPVIEPPDMKRFHQDLKKGRIDIFKPWFKSHFYAPTNLKPGKSGEEFLRLGIEDGDLNDDIIGARWTQIAANKLLPTQSQIWLEKVVGNIAKFGTPRPGSQVTQQTIIVSKEGYILDGHHRFGQAMLADPSIKLKALFIPLDIGTLVKIGRSYGNSIGNEQKASAAPDQMLAALCS